MHDDISALIVARRLTPAMQVIAFVSIQNSAVISTWYDMLIDLRRVFVTRCAPFTHSSPDDSIP